MGKIKELKEALNNADQIYLNAMEQAIDGYRKILISKLLSVEKSIRDNENLSQKARYNQIVAIHECIEIVKYKED